MGSMTASQFSALRGPWELNKMEETGKRSSWQTPALSMGNSRPWILRKLCILYELKWLRMQSEILMASRLNFEYLRFFVLFTLQRVVSVGPKCHLHSKIRKIYQLCSKIFQACLPFPIFHFSKTPVLESIPNVLWRHPWILATLPFLCPNCTG